MRPDSRPRRHWILLALVLSSWLMARPASAQAPPEATAKVPGDSATEPAPRPGSWRQMHETYLERAKEGEIDLLFLGDSITYGWNNNGKAAWERFYGEREAANFGIGGDRTQHVLWRLENGEIDGLSPEAVVLMIGTNNLGSNTPEEIADGVTAIVEKLRSALPEAKILLLAIFPRDEDPSPRRERLEAVNRQIAGLAESDDMVTYLDIGAHFLNDDGTISKEIMPDFLHLSPRGYRIWADAMEPTLWSLLEGD